MSRLMVTDERERMLVAPHEVCLVGLESVRRNLANLCAQPTHHHPFAKKAEPEPDPEPEPELEPEPSAGAVSQGRSGSEAKDSRSMSGKAQHCWQQRRQTTAW